MDNIIFRSPTQQDALQPCVIKTIIIGSVQIRYIGFARRNVKSLEEPKFSIVRETTDSTNPNYILQTIEYSGGVMERKYKFSECENLDYSFLK